MSNDRMSELKAKIAAGEISAEEGKLTALKILFDDGVLSAEEFEAEKGKVLASWGSSLTDERSSFVKEKDSAPTTQEQLDTINAELESGVISAEEAKLTSLKVLRDAGGLTDKEFAAEKSKVLAQWSQGLSGERSAVAESSSKAPEPSASQPPLKPNQGDQLSQTEPAAAPKEKQGAPPSLSPSVPSDSSGSDYGKLIALTLVSLGVALYAVFVWDSPTDVPVSTIESATKATKKREAPAKREAAKPIVEPFFEAKKPVDPSFIGSKGETSPAGFTLESKCKEQGESAGHACWLMGYRYAMGVGSTSHARNLPSQQMARVYYNRGCEKGHKLSCALAARFERDGYPGMVKRFDKGQAKLERYCRAGDVAACYWHATKVETTDQSDYSRLARRAEALCAEQTNYGLSCFIAAISVEQASGVKADKLIGAARNRYLKNLWRACRLGAGNACRLLARQYKVAPLPEALPFGLNAQRLLGLGCVYGSAGACSDRMQAGDMAKTKANLRRVCLLGYSNYCAEAEGRKRLPYKPIVVESEYGAGTVYIDASEITIPQFYSEFGSLHGDRISSKALRKARTTTTWLPPRRLNTLCRSRGGRMMYPPEWRSLIGMAQELKADTPSKVEISRKCIANDKIFGLCDLHSNRPEWVIDQNSNEVSVAGWHPQQSIPWQGRADIGVRSFNGFESELSGSALDRYYSSPVEKIKAMGLGGRCVFDFGKVSKPDNISNFINESVATRNKLPQAQWHDGKVVICGGETKVRYLKPLAESSTTVDFTLNSTHMGGVAYGDRRPEQYNRFGWVVHVNNGEGARDEGGTVKGSIHWFSPDLSFKEVAADWGCHWGGNYLANVLEFNDRRFVSPDGLSVGMTLPRTLIARAKSCDMEGMYRCDYEVGIPGTPLGVLTDSKYRIFTFQHWK